MTTEHGVTSGDLIVPLHSRRLKRVQTGQQAQHLIPAAALLFSGVQSLASGADGFERALAVGGILTSAILPRARLRRRLTVTHKYGKV